MNESAKYEPEYKNECFVFGSNSCGLHYGGSARAAYEKYGAEWGVGVGPSGNSYAIPTLVDPGGAQLSLSEIGKYVRGFLNYARLHPSTRFSIVAIGTGIAGFTIEQIAPLFTDAPSNCYFIDNWNKI